MHRIRTAPRLLTRLTGALLFATGIAVPSQALADGPRGKALASPRSTAHSNAGQVIEPSRPRFKRAGDEIVVDAQTGLMWTQSDNEMDINWNDAQAWCARKGEGWGLPSPDELGALVGMPAEFRVTGYRYWTREREGSDRALNVMLRDGTRSMANVGTTNKRAFCVRRP